MRLIVSNTLEILEPNSELRRYLKDILTLPNPKYEDAVKFKLSTWGLEKEIIQYSEEGSSITVPRGLTEHLLQDLGQSFQLEDQTVAPTCSPWPQPNVTLRPDDQGPAVEKLLQHPNGFLEAPAGSGKTIAGLEICRRLGLKALWLVHQGHLLDQAMVEVTTNFGLDPEEVGILQSRKWEVGERFTIGMIPTMRRRNLQELSETFGVIVVDEAHHVPCASFLEVVSQFRSQRIYGLTATAYRNDRLENLMFNAVGPIQARIEHEGLFEQEHLIKPDIVLRPTGWLPPNSDSLLYHEFMELMVTDAARNRLIVESVITECANGEQGIILVDRTKHAEVLTQLLKARGISCEFVVGSIEVPAKKNKKGRGKSKPRKRLIPKKLREKIVADFKGKSLQIVVATYDLLAEGFNHRPLGLLFLGSPVRYRGTVTQAIGRVQRPCEGKDKAKVIDFVDDLIPIFARQAEARIQDVYLPMEMPLHRE